VSAARAAMHMWGAESGGSPNEAAGDPE